MSAAFSMVGEVLLHEVERVAGLVNKERLHALVQHLAVFDMLPQVRLVASQDFAAAHVVLGTATEVKLV